MNRLNTILSYFPILIILNWVSCLVFFVDSPMYKEHYYSYDFIDTIIAGLSLIHAFYFWNSYTKISKYCTRGIIAITILTFLYPYLRPDFYYFLYFYIIVTIICESIRANLNEYN